MLPVCLKIKSLVCLRAYTARGRLIGKLGMGRANRVILSSPSPRPRRKTRTYVVWRRDFVPFVGRVQKARSVKIINIIIAIIPGWRITPNEYRYAAVYGVRRQIPERPVPAMYRSRGVGIKLRVAARVKLINGAQHCCRPDRREGRRVDG